MEQLFFNELTDYACLFSIGNLCKKIRDASCLFNCCIPVETRCITSLQVYNSCFYFPR